MQALNTVQKPFAAPAAAARSSGRRALAVRAAAEPEQLSRRALAGFLAAAPVLLPASRALALIPDDDDEELVEKARANRAKRLAAERETQQAFSRSAKGLGEAAAAKRSWIVLQACMVCRPVRQAGSAPAWCFPFLTNHPGLPRCRFLAEAHTGITASVPCCVLILHSDAAALPADRVLEQELIPVQRAINNLAQVRAALTPHAACTGQLLLLHDLWPSPTAAGARTRHSSCRSRLATPLPCRAARSWRLAMSRRRRAR